MTAPNSSDYELLTEHFGYPPVSLLDDIINTVNVLADRALDSVERLLLLMPPQNLGFAAPKSKSKDKDAPATSPEEAAKLEIENGTHQLETLLNASIDKNFDLFELYTMRNILTVRPDDQPFMRLAHYDGLDFSSEAPDRPTPESVTALRRRLHASQRLHLALETERVRNDALLSKLHAALGTPAETVKQESGAAAVAAAAPTGALAFLRDRRGIEEAGTEQPITTTTEFTLSQLQALRALSTSLRTILPDLGPDDTADNGAEPASQRKSWRRERLEYVEAASRKYLETSRGLELGDQGDVRDGEWQGEGRHLSKGDVEGLERVVTMLGSGEATGRGASRDEDAMDES
ncbi:Mis12 protein-domain-containing protein [Stachybotrys elegans]|uniref:Mis12 protein-domain-containing protein n=1 Tax=Stachybotrys elegans TaxID=80388 RepID=A0A8K0SFX4_9HYPO|nr:Mis12 protein-domain-containing protein [Stachybotrys elegans]